MSSTMQEAADNPEIGNYTLRAIHRLLSEEPSACELVFNVVDGGICGDVRLVCDRLPRFSSERREGEIDELMRRIESRILQPQIHGRVDVLFSGERIIDAVYVKRHRLPPDSQHKQVTADELYESFHASTLLREEVFRADFEFRRPHFHHVWCHYEKLWLPLPEPSHCGSDRDVVAKLFRTIEESGMHKCVISVILHKSSVFDIKTEETYSPPELRRCMPYLHEHVRDDDGAAISVDRRHQVATHA